jgi:hypothetical protein
MEDRGRDFVQSLERGLEVIRSFSEREPSPLTLRGDATGVVAACA